LNTTSAKDASPSVCVLCTSPGWQVAYRRLQRDSTAVDHEAAASEIT
jgi:hypothetical protein